MVLKNVNNAGEIELYSDVCHIIEGSHQRLATTVNTEICLMHWQIGNRIKDDVLYNQRAEYGKQVVKKLSDKLTALFGKGWGYEKLKHCVRSAYLFSEDEYLQSYLNKICYKTNRRCFGINLFEWLVVAVVEDTWNGKKVY